MLGFRFCRITPTRTICNRFLPPGPALARRVTPEVCRSLTAVQHLSCLPLQRSPLHLNQCQNLSHRQSPRNTMYHWISPSQSLLLLSRLMPPGLLLSSFSNSVFTKSSIRICLMSKPITRRSHATAHEPYTMFLQPLDPSCRRQSIRRGFIISLPILIIYILVYLLSYLLPRTHISRQHLDTVARFGGYSRHEGLQNVASQFTFVTSQFIHYSLGRLVMDSLVLVGIASILSSVFNRRTFFAVYILGGFLAAAVDCAWARVTNPCQSLTQAQYSKIATSARMINEASAKLNELKLSSQPFTWKGFVECLTNPMNCLEKYTKDPVHKERIRPLAIIHKHFPVVKDYLRWTDLNLASSGSLICLMSVATLIRPRTIVNLWGIRPKFQLFQLTACFCAFSVYMHLATNSRWNYTACLGGNLAAVPVWFLWLRRGHIGTLASGLRAFDHVNKPATMSLQNRLIYFALVPIWINLKNDAMNDLVRQEEELEKEARESDPPPHSDDAGTSTLEDPKKDAASDDEVQEVTPASEPAAGDNDQDPGKDND